MADEDKSFSSKDSVVYLLFTAIMDLSTTAASSRMNQLALSTSRADVCVVLLHDGGFFYVVQFLSFYNSSHNCTYFTRSFMCKYEMTPVSSPYQILATIPSTVCRTPLWRLKT
jgi:hypothetical protein